MKACAEKHVERFKMLPCDEPTDFCEQTGLAPRSTASTSRAWPMTPSTRSAASEVRNTQRWAKGLARRRARRAASGPVSAGFAQ